MTKDEAMKLAARKGGFTVSRSKYRDEQKRKQMNRYHKEGLVRREFAHDTVTFYRMVNQ